MFDNEYISLGSVSTRLNLPTSYFKQLIAAKELPYVDIGNGRLRFHEKTVREALRKKEFEQLKKQRQRPWGGRTKHAVFPYLPLEIAVGHGEDEMKEDAILIPEMSRSELISLAEKWRIRHKINESRLAGGIGSIRYQLTRMARLYGEERAELDEYVDFILNAYALKISCKVFDLEWKFGDFAGTPSILVRRKK